MPSIKITLPDGSVREYKKGITAGEIAFDIGKRLGQDAVLAKVNKNVTDLSVPINEDASIQIITLKDKEGLDALRHSVAHLLAAAVIKLWPNAKNAIGPSIENGFYQDFDMYGSKISEDDFLKIEETMRELLNTWDNVQIHEVSIKQAKKDFSWNPYKIELAEEFTKQGKTITETLQGSFLDLCKGGHIPSMKMLKPDSFKLTHLAGAYWRGKSENPQLTRIYGLAFPTKKELDEYLKMQEEAEKRDHKKLGKLLDLFTFSELVGSGLPLWTPKGTLMRLLLDDFVWALRQKRGYERVEIPHITKKELYETSGHWAKFKDDLFRIKTREGHEFAMKPMNCPHHTQIYARKSWSYRELPQRYANTTSCYRDEQTGELSGLSRVRAITQDDAHVFCRMSQVKEEFLKVWDIVYEFYSAFGFDLRVRFSVHDPSQPEKYLGGKEVWEKAEGMLRQIVESKNADWFEGFGEAAFYGPKLDFMARDALGREWQVATIQLDMNMPERFDLKCINEKNEFERIVMIHAAIMGSIERFMSILIEHCAGKFPLWLAPVQIRILTVADRFNNYAEKLKEEFEKNNIRVEVDSRTESVSYKVREAQSQKIPLILTVGEKEENNKVVAVRTLDNKVYFDVKVYELLKKILRNIEEKKVKVEI